MKTNKRLSIVLFISIILLYGIVQSQTLYNGIGYIPQSWQVEWTKAGLLVDTPNSACNLFNVVSYGAQPDNQQHDDTNAILSAVEDAKNCDGTAIVYFPPGHYKITSTIDLSRISSTENDLGHSNIIIQGSGSDHTFLEFTVGKDSCCFYIHGKALDNTKINLTSDLQKDSKILYGSFNNYSAMNWIQLCENNFPNTNKQFVGQITQLESVSSAFFCF